MAIINLGNNKVKILPDIGKTLVDTRTNMKLPVAFVDAGEESYFKEIDE